MRAFEPGVDVVMVAYRSPVDARGFIDSYLETRNRHTSLWVADVDPSDVDEEAMDLALRAVPGEHGLTVWNTNVGYAHACNSLAACGTREVIGFFNADTRLTPGVIETIYDVMMLHDDWAIVGPRQYDDHGRITAGGIFGTNEKPTFDGRWQQPDNGQCNDIRTDAISVSGSAYFVRRDVWNDLTECEMYRKAAPEAEGAFLPTPHYYEETYCSYHARAHGWKVVYFGAVGMLHRWHKASPVGGYAEQMMPISQQLFRDACDVHQIAHD